MSRIIYYYQTFCGLNKILIKNTPVTHIHLSSVHFGLDTNIEPYIHLNDTDPCDSKYDSLWLDIENASKLNIKIVLMIGGAGGGYSSLFSNFDLYYDLLYKLIKNRPFIKGIDLDVEESVTLDNIKKLINKIVEDFGEEFIITMAPIQESVESDVSGMGGFCYKELMNSEEGKYIDYLNVQFYGDYSLDAYNKVINNGYNPEMIVMGTMNADTANTVKEIYNQYGNKFGGVFFWEYVFALPNELTWANNIRSIFNYKNILNYLFYYLSLFYNFRF